MAGHKRHRGLIRQWRLVRALQKARYGMTFMELADAAEESVSLRTIRRDIDTLTLAGFPVDVDSGDGGPGAFARIYWRSIH